MFGASGQLLIGLAKGNGKVNDPTIRQDLMRLHTLNEIARMHEPAPQGPAGSGRTCPAPATSPSCR